MLSIILISHLICIDLFILQVLANGIVSVEEGEIGQVLGSGLPDVASGLQIPRLQIYGL